MIVFLLSCIVHTQKLCIQMMMDQRFCMLKPLFLTGVRCMNIETERAWHARQLVAELTLHELNSYDGIVAVIMLPAV